jgi:hypothetical protein
MAAAPLGLLASIMGGAPLELPKLSCALCLAIAADDTKKTPKLAAVASPYVNAAKTLAGGWLVCEFHAEVMAHQLAETNYSRNGGPDTINTNGTRRPLADSFTLPPAVMA